MATSIINNIDKLIYSEETACYFLHEGRILKREYYESETNFLMVSGEHKIILKLEYSYYHFIMDFLCNFLYIHNLNPNYHFIFLTNNFKMDQVEGRSYLSFLLNFFKLCAQQATPF